jgi:hypothetical protein
MSRFRVSVKAAKALDAKRLEEVKQLLNDRFGATLSVDRDLSPAGDEHERFFDITSNLGQTDLQSRLFEGLREEFSEITTVELMKFSFLRHEVDT